MTNWLKKIAQIDPAVDPVQPAEEPVEEERKIFQILEYRLAWLDERLAALNKVAAKLNLDPVGYNKLREWTEPDPRDEFGVRQRHFVEIELFGETPQLKTPSGKTYKFLSRLMHTTEGNIIKSVPGVELPESYRTIEPRCQHCNYKRRRNDTYVLKDVDTGTLVQVGSTCLKDFLGHKSANAYASWAEVLADINIELLSEDYDEEGGWGGGGGGGATTYGIERFLEMVYACMKMFGWQGRAKAREKGDVATVDKALNLYHSKNPKDRELYTQMMSELNAEDKDVLTAALEWARELKEGQSEDIDRLSDYYWNLSLACSSPVVKPATEGIVASLPTAYHMAVLKKLKPDPGTTAGNKGEIWVGRGVLEDENIYGNENSYRMRTEDNKIIQWSGAPIEQVVGAVVNIEGTIVGYSRYFNDVTTRLARIKILSDEEYGQRKTEVGVPRDLGDKPEYVPGEKVTVDVAILSTRDVESMYGSSTLYMMTDNWGNTLKWFSSGSVSFEQGERLNITGTIKSIDEYQGQPQVLLTRCKVNSRELPEGQEDPRLTPIEEKQLKNQIGKLKRELKKIRTAVGIVDHQDQGKQLGETIQPIKPFIDLMRSNVPQEARNFLDYNSLIDNYQSVGEWFNQYLPIVRQNIVDRQTQVQQERPESYELTVIEQNLLSIDNAPSQLPQAVARFTELAAGYAQRKQAFDENVPAMDALLTQIDELENQMWKHRDAVKTWGKRLASNWLGKLLRQ
jgi:hypothetical protein